MVRRKKTGEKKNKGSLSTKINLRLTLFLFVIFAIITVYTAISTYEKDLRTSIEKVGKDGQILASNLSEMFDAAFISTLSVEKTIMQELEMPKEERSRESIITDVDGKKVPLLTYYVPIKDKEGTVLGIILCDLSLDSLQEIMLRTEKPYENTYYTLVNAEGFIAGHSLIYKRHS